MSCITNFFKNCHQVIKRDKNGIVLTNLLVHKRYKGQILLKYLEFNTGASFLKLQVLSLTNTTAELNFETTVGSEVVLLNY
ncbi:hypothetical protein F8M41_026193 [Gigaspora margarita]|uniref:Uncharacterized protein n=1 Tax=Gigaspora margarita TaxID=4874 RepID=A0A8H3XIX4_GIGMA|nr:hypothetical protein F8M41_026193 [Gigaspora margarita]